MHASTLLSNERPRALTDVSTGVSLPSFPDLTVKAKYATEHRCGVVVSGLGLSDDVSGTDPLKDNLPLQVSMPPQLPTDLKQHSAHHTSNTIPSLCTDCRSQWLSRTRLKLSTQQKL